MAKVYSKLATASTVTVEHMLDAEDGVARIKQALADGLQLHDVPEILAMCERIEANAAGIREQMKEVADVEMDIDVARRLLCVGREEVWDERFRARERRLREIRKAPTRLEPVDASTNPTAATAA